MCGLFDHSLQRYSQAMEQRQAGGGAVKSVNVVLVAEWRDEPHEQ
jgi:hypothetical protein